MPNYKTYLTVNWRYIDRAYIKCLDCRGTFCEEIDFIFFNFSHSFFVFCFVFLLSEDPLPVCSYFHKKMLFRFRFATKITRTICKVKPSESRVTESKAELRLLTDECEMWKFLTTSFEDLARMLDPLKLNPAGKCPEYGNIVTMCCRKLQHNRTFYTHRISETASHFIFAVLYSSQIWTNLNKIFGKHAREWSSDKTVHTMWSVHLLYLVKQTVDVFITCAARVVLFSVVSVCVSVCLSLCQRDIAAEPLHISSRNFQGIILWSKGRKSSKWLYRGCTGDDLTYLMF